MGIRTYCKSLGGEGGGGSRKSMVLIIYGVCDLISLSRPASSILIGLNIF